MFDTARSVIAGALGVGAFLLVFWIIGVATTPGTAGLMAVGAGIHATLVGFTQILRGL